ncbi:MAG: 3-ketoacyl-ACP reductase [Lentisphaerae bacterium GWF2_52_8]|nr:MAG: 3-ketoacyl-ACP reductase [Lentisphaerae bacterium GWF2_52_8]
MKRTALVTGGTRGIGLGIARRLAMEGFDLAISGLRAEGEISGVIAELEKLGAELLYCRSDIASSRDREAMLLSVKQKFGQLNVLVNNAGIAPAERRDLLDATEESFEKVIRTNLQGPYFLTQQAARWLVSQKESDPSFPAAIINVSSVSATMVSVNRGEYCLSKAGVAMATQLWAARLGEYGIPVYEVRPGITRTDMTSGVAEKYDRLIAEGLVPMRRWGEADDVGRAVAALARGDMPYASGTVINVDGGLSIPRL